MAKPPIIDDENSDEPARYHPPGGSQAGGPVVSKPELKPCPFCGGTDLLLFPPNCREDSPYYHGDRANPMVRCMGCFAEAYGGAWDHSGKTAIAAWNNRAAETALTARIVELEVIVLEFLADKGLAYTSKKFEEKARAALAKARGES